MQQKLSAAILVLILLSFGGGYLTAQSTHSHDDEAHSEATDHDDDMATEHTTQHMDHTMYEVESNNAPTVKITVTEDAKSGWNVHIDTTNFTFTPEDVNTANTPNEGHAHLYIDGKKIARLYGSDFHYDESFEGEKSFKVTLNANDHSEYAINGTVIEDSVVVSHTAH